MSIVPASRLSSCDFALLGNNVNPAQRRRASTVPRSRSRSQVTAVNRSLALTGETIGTLYAALPIPAVSLAAPGVCSRI